MKINSICCIGAGYVGGPTMAVIAYHCPNITVNVVDANIDKIKHWNNKDFNDLPVKEPGLGDIIKKVRNKNLHFTSDIKKAIENSQMIFLAVNTPTAKSGPAKGMGADLTNIINSAKLVAQYSKDPKIVIEKSTLPVRTAEKLKEVLKKYGNTDFQIISNPEFLAEGTAIKDLFKSDRVIIGGEDSVLGKKAVNHLVRIYSKWIPKEKIIVTNIWSSELSKLASNAFLAQRLSSINSLTSFCEKTGADILEVSKAVGMDKRIGGDFLSPSLGFGGSCFQKDILNLVYISRSLGLDEVADYWEQVIIMNDYQKKRFSNRILELTKSPETSTISVLGWAFKKNTNDSRESASIYIVRNLLINNCKINIYDPWVDVDKIKYDINYSLKQIRFKKSEIEIILKKIKIFNSIKSCIKNVSSIAICTEWDEFKEFDWKAAYKYVEPECIILDGRNIIDTKKIVGTNFRMYSLGR